MAKKLSTRMAIAATITSTFGTGILFMPCGFGMLGIGNAVIAISTIAFITFYTLHSLAYSSLVVCTDSQMSYSLLAQALSPYLKRIVDFMLVGRALGTSLAITRCFISSSTALLIDSHIPLETEIIRRICLLLFIFTVGYFLTRTHISSLSFIPKISLFGIFFFIATSAYYAFSYGQPLSGLEYMNRQYSRGFIKFVFALHCQSSFLNIFNEMETQFLHSAFVVAFTASASVAVIYGLSGFTGYLAAGNDIGERHMLEIIRDRYHPLMMRVSTASFDKIGILPIIVNICFLFIWFGYVVFVYFPMIAVVQDKFSGFNLKVSRLSVVFMIGVFLFLGSFPRDLQISKLLDFNAALFTNPLGFALPSLFTMIVESRFSLKSLFGFFLFCGSILLSIKVIYGMLAQ